MDDTKNPLVEGNIYWLYEAFKVENQELDFNKPYTDNLQNAKELLLYECLMFNDDREDSIFIMQEGQLYEYFSANKYELLLKLIQYYENRMMNNYTFSSESQLKEIFREAKPNQILINKFKYGQEFKDPELKFKTKVRANVYLVFKDGSNTWVYNYELKKLLFYLKFLPKAKEIKFIRLFPPCVKTLDINVFNYVDQDDEFVETKEAQLQKVYEESKNNDQLLKSFIKKIKTIFYDRYLLNMKKMDIEAFHLNGKWYLLDLKNFIFEKYENKHVKLDSEGLFFRYVEKYKDNARMIKDPRKLKDVKIFYDAMIQKYDDLFHHVVSDDYLNHPERDKTSDNVFITLKPQSPYVLSELMKPRVNLKTFVSNATDNLWNEDTGYSTFKFKKRDNNKGKDKSKIKKKK